MPEIRGSYEVEHVPEWFHPGTSTFQGHEEFENRCSTDEVVRLRADLAALTVRLALAEAVCDLVDGMDYGPDAEIYMALAAWHAAMMGIEQDCFAESARNPV